VTRPRGRAPHAIPGDRADLAGFPRLVGEFCEHMAARGYSPRTIGNRRAMLAHLASWLAERARSRAAAGRRPRGQPAASPQQLLDRCEPASGTAGRALRGFFTSRGLALPGDEKQRRAAARRRHHLDAVPAGLATAVAGFNCGQLEERERARRAGRRPLSDITLESRLRILRDMAVHLASARPVTSWSQVTTAGLEGFLSLSPGNRHQRTYVLRGFSGWAKRHNLILIDPATALQLGSQPAFTGSVLDDSAQRALFRRWASNAAHPHERLIGLPALLHAASNAQLRGLTTGDADHAHRTLNLASRPFPAPLDPVSWAALNDCLHHRTALRTLNPHVIVTSTTRTGDSPAHQSYLSRALRPAGTTPALCRQTRISQLVTDLDPKLAAAALGMQDSGLVRYLAGNVDSDRLAHTPASAASQPVRGRRHLAHLDANLCELDKELAEANFKGFGHHPLLAECDDTAEPLAWMMCRGSAGSNTASAQPVTEADRRWMELAIDLTHRCPPSDSAYSVGAVIVGVDGQELARGYSREGDPHVHAEESALGKLAPDDPRLAGATLYSTLEPCSRRSSRPRSCTDLVLGTGISRVVIAWLEPGLFVADAQGRERLEAAGVEVAELEDLSGRAKEPNKHLPL